MNYLGLRKRNLSLIFALSLFLSLAISVILPVSVPISAATTPCEQLEADIKAEARRDARADRLNLLGFAENQKQSVEDLQKLLLAQDNSQCFKNNKAWKDLYLVEYEKHHFPAWMPVSLVLLVGLIAGAALNDALKKTLTLWFETIGRWIYNKLAGTPFFENIALKKYRLALINSYEKLKIPFRQGKPLNMREIYVPLKVAGKKDSPLIEAEEALQYRRLMVKGSPGSGKTMLMKYLALSFADVEQRLTQVENSTQTSILGIEAKSRELTRLHQTKWLKNLPDRPIPIYIALNRFNDADLTVKKIEQLLVEVCCRNNFPKADRFIQQGLKQGRLLLLFDGLDEVSSNVRSHAVQCLKDF